MRSLTEVARIDIWAFSRAFSASLVLRGPGRPGSPASPGPWIADCVEISHTVIVDQLRRALLARPPAAVSGGDRT
ncbi:MAG: hypothetical protein U5N53_09715 [Mycobacterium sp.]|nr:hypothetical protein [Mycobacterium sp.]